MSKIIMAETNQVGEWNVIGMLDFVPERNDYILYHNGVMECVYLVERVIYIPQEEKTIILCTDAHIDSKVVEKIKNTA